MRNLGLMAVVLTTFPILLAGCVPGETPEDSGTSLIFMVLFLVGIFVVFYFLMIRPQRKRQKEHGTLVQDLKKGDRVISAGGIYGQIENVSENSVVLKVESGATIRIARESIVGRQQIL